MTVGEYELFPFEAGRKYMVRYQNQLFGYISEPTEEEARRLVQSKLLYNLL